MISLVTSSICFFRYSNVSMACSIFRANADDLKSTTRSSSSDKTDHNELKPLSL